MFSLDLDNVASNKVAVKDMIKVLKKKSPLVCNGLLFHVRFANYVLNLVTDGLKNIAWKCMRYSVICNGCEVLSLTLGGFY